jgi:hypothetical protein
MALEGSNLLTITELHDRVLELARVLGTPPHLVPTMRISEGNGLPHLEVESGAYHYVHAERGVERDRFTTTSIDELLYRVFRDVASSMSPALARPHRTPGKDFRRQTFRQQILLLERLDPEWAARCAAEHAKVLAEHPFVDGLA